MIKIFIPTVILMTFVTSSVSARDLDVNCKALTSSYESYDALYDAVREANTTKVAPADFYDTIACECRMRPNQTRMRQMV